MFDEDALPARPRRRGRSGTRAVVSSLVGTVIIGGLVAGGAWVANHPQPIIDQVTVWQYEPTPVVAAHAERLALTDHGRFLYYASRPEVSSAEVFATECPKDEDEQQFGILGCYVPADKAIFLFDVTDERLDGAEEVVAAHEMLHAAWDRMSDDEREGLSTLLEAEYDKLSHDPRFSERMAFYARTEPGQRANELHSIIGTEVGEVSPELETYYARYFADRGIVTGLYSSSHAVFVELQARADALVAEMDTLRLSTEADYATYTADYDTLNADILAFNARADAGNFTSQAAFDRAKSALLARGEALDDLYASITERVDRYNALVAELETLNAVSAELQRGLNIGGEVDSGL